MNSSQFVLLPLALAFAVGCNEAPKPDPAQAGSSASSAAAAGNSASVAGDATSTASSASAAGSALSPAPDGPAPLTIAKGKAFNDSDAAAIGTLPEGVGIAVGERAPDFSLPDLSEEKIKLAELLTKSEVLLVFYRGGW